MISGIPVTILTAVVDADGRRWNADTVENVLVAPYAESDGNSTLKPSGHQTVYHMAIPKIDTHRWEGALVQFFGCTWAVVGIPTQGIDALIPGPWNKKVLVELYRTGAPDAAGLWNTTLMLLPASETQDAGGYRQLTDAEGRDVTAIFTKGVDSTEESRDRKSRLRKSASAEVWAGDYLGEHRVKHDGTLYDVTGTENTGRGTRMLRLMEVWR